MISLNDYLYSGDTVLKILHKYSEDLKENASSWKTNPYLKERMTKREMQLAAMFMFSPKVYDMVLGITGR